MRAGVSTCKTRRPLVEQDGVGREGQPGKRGHLLPLLHIPPQNSEILNSKPACQVVMQVCLSRWEGRMYCI